MPEKDENNKEGGKPKDDGTSFESFGKWLESLSDEQKSVGMPLYESDVQGLKNTVQALRDEKKELSDSLREAIKNAGQDTDLKEKLTDLQEKVENANKRAGFYEQSLQAGCRNPKLAFVLAKTDDLFKRDGSPDWGAIKESAPELFGKPSSTKNNAGEGTDDDVPGSKPKTMNDWIRKEAGVKS